MTKQERREKLEKQKQDYAEKCFYCLRPEIISSGGAKIENFCKKHQNKIAGTKRLNKLSKTMDEVMRNIK